MKNTNFRKRLLASGSALQVLAVVGGGLAAASIAAPAAAQDYTTGSVSGTVVDENGASVPGATVTISSGSQGFERNVTSGPSGGFRFNALPTGEYDVTVTGPSIATYTAEGVRVLAGQSLDLRLEVSSTDVIVVTGRSVIRAFEGTTVGLNVDVEELAKTVPLPRDLTSVVLLAPGTTQGDSAFGSLASIGGSSVAENAYYVNGLNITNFDNYLGSARVPFEFYRSVEVKSGGYPAEFGRATGGIVNAVTKSGSNDYTAALHLNYSPNFLRSSAPERYSRSRVDDNGTPADFSDDTIETNRLTNRSLDRAESYSAIAEVGLPIIKDRLFVYGLAEFRNSESTTVNAIGGFADRSQDNDPFWGVKVDAFPIDSQHLEFTIFDSRRTVRTETFDYSQPAGLPGAIGGKTSEELSNFGGVNFVGKYTGTFTDWLTVSAAYGRMRDRFDSQLVGQAATLPYVVNASGGTVNGTPNGALLNAQTSSSLSAPYETEREFYRADADLYFNILGEHHIRFGFDTEDNTLSRGTVRTGAEYLDANGLISDAALNANAGSAGYAVVLRAGNVAELNYFNSGGEFTSTNRAFYIQDEWSVTDRLTLNLGLRRDDFQVNKADGSTFVELEENYAPRLGFSYDVGDMGEVYGYYGQYFLPVASNTAFRFAGGEYFIRQRFNYSGFDSEGVPIFGTQNLDNPAFVDDCAFALLPGGPTTGCIQTGDGSVPPSDEAFAANLKATKETEWILGYRHNLGEFRVGIAYIHRNLDRTAEDVAIDLGVQQYCLDNGITGCDLVWTADHQFSTYNIGEDLVITLDGDDSLTSVPLDGQQVTITADQMPYPDAERKYDAVELTFDRPWDGSWSLGGSYTWSDSRGNTEGYVQSDFGQDDAGITQDFDFPSFTEFAYGKLPNHRTHRFKLFGAAELGGGFILGGNVSVESPRKLSCIGYHPTDDVGANSYGAASHYCNLEPAPRGEGLESDWISVFDVSARYNIEVATGQTITFRADVFNLFNSRGVTQRDEIGDNDLIDDPVLGRYTEPNPNYGIATGYQAPRSVRLGIDVNF